MTLDESGEELDMEIVCVYTIVEIHGNKYSTPTQRTIKQCVSNKLGFNRPIIPNNSCSLSRHARSNRF